MSFLLLQKKFPQLAAAFNFTVNFPIPFVLDNEHKQMITMHSYLENLLYQAVVRKVSKRVNILEGALKE